MTVFRDPEKPIQFTDDAVRTLISTWQNASLQTQRAQAWKQLHVYGTALERIIRHLEGRLERGDRRLNDPANYTAQREDQWLQWLREYEDAVCLQSEITAHVVERDPSRVVQRKSSDDAEFSKAA